MDGIIRDVHAEILNGFKNGAVLHADETGWRVRGKNCWLWVFDAPDTAYFTVDKTRGSAVVRRVLGEIFFGVLVVDGWNAYLYLLGEVVFQRHLKRLKQCLANLVQWPNPGDVLEEIIKKVKRQQPRILTFVEHPDVPFHNNYAEYLIRIGVRKRKISGGSVSAEGAASYAILLSIYTTCKLRGISFPKYLKESLKHYIKAGAPLSLKSYQDATAAVSEMCPLLTPATR